MASDLVPLISQFGYERQYLEPPAAWFFRQNYTTELAVVNRICFESYFSIDDIHSYLLDASPTALNPTFSNMLYVCQEIAYLSVFPSSESGLTWLVAQNATIQESAVQRICSDWSIWTPSLIRSFSLMASGINLPHQIYEFMNDCGPFRIYKITLSSMYYSYIGLLFSSVMLFVVFTVFVLFYVTPGNEWNKVATPFNVAFLVGFISLMGCDICYIFYVSKKQAELFDITKGDLLFSDNQSSNWIFVIIQFLQAIWTLSYLYFSYKRSDLQLKRVFRKKYKYLMYVFTLSPILVLSPIPLAFAQAFKQNTSYAVFNFYFQGIASLTLLLFDTVFLYTFSRYLVQTTVDKTQAIDPKFLIISRFGIAAVAPCLAQSMLSIYLLVGVSSTTYDYKFIALATTISSVLLHCVMGLMVGLKISLYRHAVYEYSQATERINSGSGGKKTHSGNDSSTSSSSGRSESVTRGPGGRTESVSMSASITKNGTSSRTDSVIINQSPVIAEKEFERMKRVDRVLPPITAKMHATSEMELTQNTPPKNPGGLNQRAKSEYWDHVLATTFNNLICSANQFTSNRLSNSYELPADWFTRQTIEREKEIVSAVCSNQGYNYFSLAPMFQSLLEDTNVNAEVLSQIDTCKEILYLSYFPGSEASLFWLSNQTQSTQSDAIKRICSEWSVWPPSVIRAYSLIATGSPSPLNSNEIEAMDSCDVIQEYKSTMGICYHIYIGLLVIIVLLLVVYAAFVYISHSKTNGSAIWMSITTPFNISFIIGFMSVITIDVTYLIYLQDTIHNLYSVYNITAQLWFSLESNQNILYTVILVANAIWSISYLYFSWRRSEMQVRQIFPHFYNYIAYAFLFSPILILSPIPAAILVVINPHSGVVAYMSYFSSVAAFTLLLLDLVFLYAFLKFLSRTTEDMTPIDKKFRIIATYGIAVVVPMQGIACVSTYVASNPTLDYHTMALLSSLISMFQHVVMLMMVMLKIGLYRQAQNEITAALEKMGSSKLDSSKRALSNENVFLGAGSRRDYSISFADSSGFASLRVPSKAIAETDIDSPTTNNMQSKDITVSMVAFYLN
ncbi:hypothetical protein BCR33DRAFT_853756 [Rhizoclosmatium globosum]|uniref:Uncharacterized protein n=1 Tax=Rhizoclosmatium globosum TaxID=329046 RepID=A0A1Y2BVK8_9FUNG|nr:hypothetical protein BCR33DRAFT_853756 [Rhizoclosmatium globosum]|eukprot:ORY38773.1 hypothetical protein BCR33DRAFT_853756 [Rhizoclosmatium globosum]